MPDRGGEAIGEFSRDGLTFTVRRAYRGLFVVTASEGDGAPVTISRMYPFAASEWFSTWRRDSWRPWVDMMARQIIDADQAKAVQ